MEVSQLLGGVGIWRNSMSNFWGLLLMVTMCYVRNMWWHVFLVLGSITNSIRLLVFLLVLE